MKKIAIFLGIVLGLIMLVCVAIFALRKPLIKKLADGAILAIQKDIGREISVEEYDISGMGELQLRHGMGNRHGQNNKFKSQNQKKKQKDKVRNKIC